MLQNIFLTECILLQKTIWSFIKNKKENYGNKSKSKSDCYYNKY